MGRYTGPKCRLCRRAQMKLFIKGLRCITEKCSFSKRPTPPGSATQRRSKPTNYGIQLNEKQKMKRMYGVLERQFRRFFSVASKSKGVTGRQLIQLLERRLDNVIYRSLIAFSRNQARQIVNHGFVVVNGRRVDVPSCIVKQGQTIKIKARESILKDLKANIEIGLKDRSIPSWLEINKDDLKINIVRLPEKEDLVIAVDEQLVVELYSK